MLIDEGLVEEADHLGMALDLAIEWLAPRE